MLINPKFIDTSHYDRITDISALPPAGILGVVNKATEGPGMVDKTFAARRDYVRGAGLKYGAYHFLRPGNIAAQADHFLETANPDADLLVALDWEDTSVPLSDAKLWLSIVKAKIFRWPVLYSYSAMLKAALGNRPDPMLTQVRLWLAQYSASPSWPTQIWAQPWAWQYTGDGSGLPPHNMPGVVLDGGKGIDINSYDGPDDRLRAEWAS